MHSSTEVKEQVKKAVVIYHANCMDGFASAWAFHVLKQFDYPDGVEYIPVSYNEPNSNYQELVGWDVYILDFSYPREDLILFCEAANKVVLLDHHKTAQAALENWEDKPDNLEIVFDMIRSGAGITWDYFAHEPSRNDIYKSSGPIIRPPLINYIEDRDLWKFDLDYSKEINAVVSVTPKDFKAYNHLSNNLKSDKDKIISIGVYLSLQHQQICEQIVLDARPCNILGDYDGLVCNCTPQFSSEVGNLLARKCGTFGATYHSDSTGDVKWSLRSNGDYDVSKIAKQFGGGGHRNAASFKLSGGEGSGVNEIKVWNYVQVDPTIAGGGI